MQFTGNLFQYDITTEISLYLCEYNLYCELGLGYQVTNYLKKQTLEVLEKASNQMLRRCI